MDNVDINDSKVVGEFTSSTRVILSFGSALGGFEFALQLRHDIMQSRGMSWDDDPAYIYVDAASLIKQAQTQYTWDEKLGIYKMSNPFWAQFYKDAMDNATNMIFLVTQQWLSSQWCWEELDFYAERFRKNPNIKPIFVVFPDAVPILKKNEIVLRDGSKRHPSQIWNEIKNISNSCVIDIETAPIPDLQTVIVEGATYTYHYRYVCNESELNKIISSISF